MSYKDITGQRYGRLVAIEKVRTDEFRNAVWRMRCDCGAEKELPLRYLQKTKSCGCYRRSLEWDAGAPNGIRAATYNKHIGITYGKITIIELIANENATIYAGFSCECGGSGITQLRSIIRGETKSCGCLRRLKTPSLKERKKNRIKQRMAFKKEVYKKCYNECIICGSDKTQLHIHHYLSYTFYPNSRTLVANGVLLCKPCHLEFHSIYGSKGFTPSDVKEYKYLKTGHSVCVGV